MGSTNKVPIKTQSYRNLIMSILKIIYPTSSISTNPSARACQTIISFTQGLQSISLRMSGCKPMLVSSFKYTFMIVLYLVCTCDIIPRLQVCRDKMPSRGSSPICLHFLAYNHICFNATFFSENPLHMQLLPRKQNKGFHQMAFQCCI